MRIGSSTAPPPSEAAPRASIPVRGARRIASTVARAAARFEDAILAVALIGTMLGPLAQMVLRTRETAAPGLSEITRHLTLWVALLGAAVAARERKLIALATASLLPEGRARRAASIAAGSAGAAVCTALAFASARFVRSEREFGGELGFGVATWVAQLVLPIAFALLAIRLVWRASDGWVGRAVAAVGVGAGLALALEPALVAGPRVWPVLIALVGFALLGAPIFAALGGAAVLLFASDGIDVAAVPLETYTLAVSPTLTALPLFTLTGFLLAEGRGPERLLRLFRAWLGWLPGGTAVGSALLCAFFTLFTGGSGVTILALGGLLLPVLTRDRYPERFSIGLVTASGGLGSVFPPALPLILYAVVAQMPIEDMFVGGLLPGALMMLLVAAAGVPAGLRAKAQRVRFSLREALAASWDAKWLVAIPIVALVAILGGYATIVEAAAVAAFAALIVQTALHRDVRSLPALVRVIARAATLVGSALIILGLAVGLTGYLVDAQVPSRLVELVQRHVTSPLVFLLALNAFLLVVGACMDIYSAIAVIVPLILPLGAAYGIHPIHLGIVFVANLELADLTPPIGLNLLLSSQRFERPLGTIYRATLPFYALLAIAVLVITYVPWLSLVFVR